jgi:hypothetical protein
LFRGRLALTGALVVTAFVLLAVFAPAWSSISGNDPYAYHLGLLAGSGLPRGAFGGVSGDHWLGVEPQTGRELFSIVAYGARVPPPTPSWGARDAWWNRVPRSRCWPGPSTSTPGCCSPRSRFPIPASGARRGSDELEDAGRRAWAGLGG